MASIKKLRFYGMMKNNRVLYVLMMASIVATACAGRDESPGDIRTGDLPTLEIEQLFTVSETPTGDIRQVNIVKTNRDGELFVSDWGSYKIHHYTKDGTFLTSIGGEGGDAGEFLLINSLDFDEQNRLIAYDDRLKRHTIFEQAEGEWAVADTLSFSPSPAGMVHYLNERLLLTQKTVDERLNENLFQLYRVLKVGTLDGEWAGDDSLRVKSHQMLAEERVPPEEAPFSHRTYLQADRDGKFYVLETESFRVTTYDTGLNPVDTLYAPVARLYLQEKDQQDARARVTADLRQLSDRFLPNTKPVARNFVLDDNKRMWIRTYDSPEYLLLGSDGTPLGSFDLPVGFTLHHVAGNRLYASGTMATGDEVRVFRYSMPE